MCAQVLCHQALVYRVKTSNMVLVLSASPTCGSAIACAQGAVSSSISVLSKDQQHGARAVCLSYVRQCHGMRAGAVLSRISVSSKDQQHGARVVCLPHARQCQSMRAESLGALCTAHGWNARQCQSMRAESAWPLAHCSACTNFALRNAWLPPLPAASTRSSIWRP